MLLLGQTFYMEFDLKYKASTEYSRVHTSTEQRVDTGINCQPRVVLPTQTCQADAELYEWDKYSRRSGNMNE